MDNLEPTQLPASLGYEASGVVVGVAGLPNPAVKLQVMKITTIVRFGVAALVMGALFGVGLPVKADQLVWVRAQQLDYFRARGLMPPGSYSHNENQKPTTIAVNKAGQGVGQTTSKPAKKNTQHISSAKKDSSS